MDDTLRQIIQDLVIVSEEVNQLRPEVARLRARVEELEGAQLEALKEHVVTNGVRRVESHA